MLPANAYTIRPATPADDEALAAVARLDGQRPLGGRILLAEDDGSVVAGFSLDEGRSVADPFRPTGAARVLLRARASSLVALHHRPELRERLRDAVSVRWRAAAGFGQV
jgi:hypothetical protein